MKILQFFSSLRFTKALLLVLIGELIVFTVIPFEKSPFLNPLFLFPVLLFLTNLTACTINRIISKKSWRNLHLTGPDLIHIALIFIIILGILSPFLRHEESKNVKKGDVLSWKNQYNLKVTGLDFSTYADGQIKEWRILLQSAERSYTLRVNHPVKLKGVKLFLTGFATTPVAIIDSKGSIIKADLSQGISIAGIHWELSKLNRLEQGFWELTLHDNNNKTMTVRTGEELGDGNLQEIRLVQSAVIQIVSNPLTPFLIISFILLSSGLILTAATYYRRRKNSA